MLLFLFERERMSGRGAEREGDTESKAGSGLRAVSTEPNVGLELKSFEILTWAKTKSQMLNLLTNWATQATQQ